MLHGTGHTASGLPYSVGVADYSHMTLGVVEGLALPSQHRPSQDAQGKTQPWEWASVVPYRVGN